MQTHMKTVPRVFALQHTVTPCLSWLYAPSWPRSGVVTFSCATAALCLAYYSTFWTGSVAGLAWYACLAATALLPAAVAAQYWGRAR